MRVQATHNLADDARALHMATIGAQSHLRHLVQDPTLDWLQAVARVWECPGVDD